MRERLETATLGAGCFWCVEAVFRSLKGVEKVQSAGFRRDSAGFRGQYIYLP